MVCAEGWRRRRRRRARRRDTESKTRTPHKDVGNNYFEKKPKKKQNKKERNGHTLYASVFVFFLFFPFFSFAGDLMTGTFENVKNSRKNKRRI